MVPKHQAVLEYHGTRNMMGTSLDWECDGNILGRSVVE